MRHRWQPIHEHLSGHEMLIDRQGQPRPHNISSFEDFNPIVILDDGFDEPEFAPAVTGIHLDPLLAWRVLLAGVELRWQLFLAGLGLGFILLLHGIIVAITLEFLQLKFLINYDRKVNGNGKC